jgi:hypothetical protein
MHTCQGKWGQCQGLEGITVVDQVTAAGSYTACWGLFSLWDGMVCKAVWFVSCICELMPAGMLIAASKWVLIADCCIKVC